MAKPRFTKFNGELSPAQVARGINLANANARRLAKDAEILFKEGRFPSSMALSILSIEESGKVGLLRQLATAEGEAERRALWKAYRRHTKKNYLWIVGQLVAEGARTLEGLRAVGDPGSDHPDLLEELKQLCLYTDCFGGGKWSSPEELETDGLAPYLLKIAEILARPREVTVLEIELWRKHFLPLKNATADESKSALTRWYHEMKLRGLTDMSVEEIEAFLGPHSEQHQA